MILALKQTLANAVSMAWRAVAAKHRFVSRPQLSMPISVVLERQPSGFRVILLTVF